MRTINTVRVLVSSCCLYGGMFCHTASAQRPELVVQAGHHGGINSVVFSPDGRIVASGSEDKTIKLWDVGSGLELRTLSGHIASVDFVAFSPDGRTLLSSDPYTSRLWDVANGHEHELNTLENSTASSIALDSHGHPLVAIGNADGSLKVWDFATKHELHTLAKGTAEQLCVDKFCTIPQVDSVTFGPQARTIASERSDGTIELWDVATGGKLHTLEGQTDEIKFIAFSPDGRTLASAGLNGTIVLWDVYGGQKLYTLASEMKNLFIHSDGFFNYGFDYKRVAVAFSPDGHILVSGSFSGKIKFWNVANGRELKSVKAHIGQVRVVAFSRDGRTLASGGVGGSTVLWDVAAKQELYPRPGRFDEELDALFDEDLDVDSLAFSKDGRIVASGRKDSTIKLLDVTTGRELRKLKGEAYGFNGFNSIAFSPDRQTLASGTSATVLWDLTGTRREPRKLGGTERITSVALAFSPDGHTLASGPSHGKIKIWDVATGVLLLAIPDDEDVGSFGVTSLDFSPDGHTLVAGGGSVMLWDVSSGHELWANGIDDEIYSVAFSSDGHTIASGGATGSIRLWDAADGHELRRLAHYGPPILSLAFSPNGHTLAARGDYGDEGLRLWDVLGGGNMRILKSTIPFFAASSVSFSWDGSKVAAGGFSGEITLWDVASGSVLYTLPAHSTAVASLAFSPNGQTLASGGLDGQLKLWDVSNYRELITLFDFGENGYAAVDPESRFDASLDGMNLMHWVVGRLEPIEAAQLKQRYYEDWLLAKTFNKQPVRQVEAFTDPKLYPQVSLTPPSVGNPKLRIHLSDRGGGIGPVQVLLNGKEIEADARGGVKPTTKQVDLYVKVANHPYLIPGADNVLEVRAYNAEEYLVSRGDRVHYKAPGQTGRTSAIRPSFWAIVAGISDYQSKDLHLSFSAKDASDMRDALRIGAVRLFREERVHITLLTNAKVSGAISPTRDNLKAAFQAAEKAKPTDILVVYLTGHGVNYGGQGKEADYYYLTQEATQFDLTDPELRSTTAVSSQELTEWIKRIPALKQILVLDTCGAARLVQKLTEGRGVSDSEVRSLDRMKDRTGLFILAGSAANAESYEASPYAHGLLTYSLLVGMRGPGLRENQFVDVNRWFDYAMDEVPRLAKDLMGIQQPMPAIPYGGESFDVGEVTDEDKASIPLAIPQALFLQSRIEEEVRPLDSLKLSAKVNMSLRNVSARGPNPALAYVDVSDFAGAYLLGGRYRIEGSSVKVKMSLFIDGKETGSFAVDGNTTELDKLATNIVGEAERLIPRPK